MKRYGFLKACRAVIRGFLYEQLLVVDFSVLPWLEPQERVIKTIL